MLAATPSRWKLTIVEAVKKATPSLLLVGAGVPGREKWIPRNLARFNSGIYLWCSDLFEVFAERRSKPSKSLFRKGLEWMPVYTTQAMESVIDYSFIYGIMLIASRAESGKGKQDPSCRRNVYKRRSQVGENLLARSIERP